jgi:iduronate 2-sulfatase
MFNIRDPSTCACGVTILLACVMSLLASADNNVPIKQTNLLFIMFDDLRPELSVYGRDHMITPNFDRLARQSVVFDHTYVQIAVCNPSRDSMLTGLRPDTVGTYSFQSSFRPFRVFPSELISAGYLTASIGKIAHWEGDDKTIWNFLQWDNGWYEYQGSENNHMNSSTMPDKIKPEDQFRDHLFADKTLETMRALVKKPNYFMLSVGFKLPHLAVHVPYRYYEMYKNMSEHPSLTGSHTQPASWRLKRNELRFPISSPDVAYRCCANPEFEYMKDEGATKSDRKITLGDINYMFPDRVHDELMMGYCAGVTYVDYQLGRLLDEMDKLNLWGNTTIILTSDHGMHNGEKGMWEKWTLFDESVRVPLIIYHPQSPFRGQHFKHPVELLDVYPTVTDLLRAPIPKLNARTHTSDDCKRDTVCKPLQGKSLAPIVLGRTSDRMLSPTSRSTLSSNNQRTTEQTFARIRAATQATTKSGKPAPKSLSTAMSDSIMRPEVPVAVVPKQPKQLKQPDLQSVPQSQMISKFNPKAKPKPKPKPASLSVTEESNGNTRANTPPKKQLVEPTRQSRAGTGGMFSSMREALTKSFLASNGGGSARAQRKLVKLVDGEVGMQPFAAHGLRAVQPSTAGNKGHGHFARRVNDIDNTTVNDIDNTTTAGNTKHQMGPAHGPHTHHLHSHAPNSRYLAANNEYVSSISGSVINGITQRPLDDSVVHTFYANTHGPQQDNNQNMVNNVFVAISQSWRCAERAKVLKATEDYQKLDLTTALSRNATVKKTDANWYTCDLVNYKPDAEISSMGYSMRTDDYRYTAWFNYNRQTCTPNVDSLPLFEEVSPDLCPTRRCWLVYFGSLILIVRAVL